MTEETRLTIKDVATQMRCHPKKVRGLIKEGKLKANKFGGTWLIVQADVTECITGEAPKVEEGDLELTKATREANLLEKQVAIAKFKQDLNLINAEMTPEVFEEKIKAFGEQLLEQERLMAEMVKIKEAQKLIFGKDFERVWIEFAHTVDGGLEREEENTSEGVE